MKQLVLLGISLLAVSACTPQSAPPPSAAPAPAPASLAQQASAPAGSPSNTTRAFDGAYDGSFVQNMSAGRTTLDCPNYRVAPALTIRNGLAQFQTGAGAFQGYVTPQGALTMQGERGQVFQGQIDPYYVVTGQATGPNCIYDASWKRSKIY
jgi:hypothetical protein